MTNGMNIMMAGSELYKKGKLENLNYRLRYSKEFNNCYILL